MGLIENLTSIKSQITSLITYANTTTGKSDTTIGDAVDSLVAGYGGGGGNPEIVEELCTLTTDTSLMDLINGSLFDIKPKYPFGLVTIYATGTTSPTRDSGDSLITLNIYKSRSDFSIEQNNVYQMMISNRTGQYSNDNSRKSAFQYAPTLTTSAFDLDVDGILRTTLTSTKNYYFAPGKVYAAHTALHPFRPVPPE